MKKQKNSKVSLINILAGVGVCVVLLISITYVADRFSVMLGNGRLIVANPIDDSSDFIVEDDLGGFQPDKDEDCTYLLSNSYNIPNHPNHSAYAMAVDKNGLIYISDISKYGNKGMKFGTDGKFISTFGSANSPVGYPSDIDTDKDGNIYVIDRPSDAIIKYDANFKEVWLRTYPQDPARLSVYSPDAGDGFIFVMDWGGRKVKKFNLAGDFIKEWIAYGNDIVAGTNAIVFVSDTNNNKLLKFSLDGDSLGFVDLAGIMEGPTQMGIDGVGDLYVADKFGRLVKFDKDGNFIEQLMPKGSIDGLAGRMAVGPNGDVYISGGSVFLKYSKVCGSIVIKKIVDPTNSLPEFSFKTNYKSGSFALKNNQVNISGKLPNGVYTVEELFDDAYKSLNISCVDPTGGTRADNATRTATIVLDSSEIVKCTFTNTKIITPENPRTDFSDQ